MGKKLAPEFTGLCNAVGHQARGMLNATRDKAEQTIGEVLAKVSALPDDAWAQLPIEQQAWFDKAAELVNGGASAYELTVLEDTAPQERAKVETPAAAKEAHEAAKPVASKRQPKTVTATAADGTTQQAKATGRPADTKMSATQWLRKHILLNPDRSYEQVAADAAEQGFDRMPSKNTMQTMYYEAHSTLKILGEAGRLADHG